MDRHDLARLVVATGLSGELPANMGYIGRFDSSPNRKLGGSASADACHQL
jgi:hypothetical protein